MTRVTAAALIRDLGLAPHPEGGFFRETHRAPLTIPAGALPVGYAGPRSAATAIYYLVTRESFSALHRLRGDELFHFYLGDPVEMLQLDPGGAGRIVVLGRDVAAGMHPQVLVPWGTWQGSRVRDGGELALLGTTMSPGFDGRDFELGRRDDLLRTHPGFRDTILALTCPG